MEERECDGKLSIRTRILIDNYRESRDEGIRLVHSAFSDVTFSIALIGTIIGGGVIANEPKLLLLIPALIGGIAVYAVQKLRVNNLITCYMIYLEREINKDFSRPVMIWNSQVIGRNVSAGRHSAWGHAVLFFAVVAVSVMYSGICLWPVSLNGAFFSQNPAFVYIYGAVCLVVLGFNIAGVLGILSVTRKHSPEYIEKLVKPDKDILLW